MKPFSFTFFLIVLSGCLFSQPELSDSVLTMIQSTSGKINSEKVINLSVGNKVFSALILDGDTIIIANLGNVTISSPKKFANHKDFKTYIKYRRYAAIVFPYAKEAIRIFHEADYVTIELRKRKRKKYLRKLAKELKYKFEKPLKGLSKTQGKILVKMIERELGLSMYALIKNTNGWWKAMYWNRASRLFGYRLKEGYTYGDDSILDVVLLDFDFPSNINAK